MVLKTLILKQPTYMIPLKWVILINIKPCYKKKNLPGMFLCYGWDDADSQHGKRRNVVVC